MQTRIASLIEERGVAHAAMSHDLRTYLARLTLRIEAIPDDASRGKARSEIEEMGRMVEDSLALLRLDANGLGETNEPVDLRGVVAAIAEDYDWAKPRTVAPSGASSTVGAEGDTPFLARGDRALLRRAIENLVENDERHAGGEIVLEKEADRLVVIVRDRGPGILSDEIEGVLRPFERGDRARTLDLTGSGLGLAIASRVAEVHGGSLTLNGRNGGGLEAGLNLPREESPA